MMKNLKSLWIVIILIFISSITQAQWNKIYEDTTSGYIFRKLDIIDSTGYILAGKPGKSCIYKTINSGVNWDTTEFNKSFYAMHFPTKDTGFVGGVNSLFLRTFDGGDTWEQLPPSVFSPTLIWIKSLAFYNGKIGVASQDGLQYITYDSGSNWSIIQNSTSGFNIEAIENTIYAGTSGSHFVFSKDTLSSIITNSLNIQASSNEISIVDDTVCISMMGQSGFLYNYSTNNYGVVSIGKISDNLSNYLVYHFPELYSVQSIVKKSSSIYAQCNLYTSSFTSSLYYFLKSPDNGQNWYLQQTDSSNGQVNGLIWKIRCLNDSTCFGLAEKALYKTTNGGGALGQQVGFLYETTGVVDVKLNNNFLSPNPATQSISVSNIPPNSKFKISTDALIFNH
jgi:photosystem II stability/assembly factor-like uncharacterized protein